MLYLLLQICWYLLAALLIGGVIGWLLKSFLCERDCDAKVGEWKAKYSALEGRYASLEASGGGNASGKLSAAGSVNADGDMDALKAHISGLEETNRLQADRIADLEGRLTAGAEAKAGDAELAAENARLKGEVSSLKTKVAAGAAAGAAVGAVASAKASGGDAKLEAENRKLKSDVDALNSKLAASAKASGGDAKLEAENRKLKGDVDALNSKLAASAKASGSGDAKLKDELDKARADLKTCTATGKKLTSDLTASESANAKLEKDLEACKARYAKLQEQANAKPASAPKASGKKEKFTTDAPAPKSLLKKAEGKKDDLKEIWGVGPVMEKTMNQLGIFHFRQVAGLSKRDVEWVSANINTFPDRIERDKWVSQAAELHKKYYK